MINRKEGESFESADRQKSVIRATIIKVFPAADCDCVNLYLIRIFERYKNGIWEPDGIEWEIEDLWFDQRAIKPYSIRPKASLGGRV